MSTATAGVGRAQSDDESHHHYLSLSLSSPSFSLCPECVCKRSPSLSLSVHSLLLPPTPVLCPIVKSLSSFLTCSLPLTPLPPHSLLRCSPQLLLRRRRYVRHGCALQRSLRRDEETRRRREREATDLIEDPADIISHTLSFHRPRACIRCKGSRPFYSRPLGPAQRGAPPLGQDADGLR